MKQHECEGICEYCLDEYDERQAPRTKLYRIRGILMCGSCANECEGDRQFAEMAYGSD
jgi:hypothetical protein